MDKDIFLKSSFNQQNRMFLRAAENGDNNSLVWMANNAQYSIDKAMWGACNHRQIETMKLLYGMGAKMKAGYFVSAVLKNWTDMAMWLYTIDRTCIDEYIINNWFCLLIIVCNNRQMAMLSWFLERYKVNREQLASSIIHDDVKRFLVSEYSGHS